MVFCGRSFFGIGFRFEYGKFYDWLYSPYIRSGIVVAVVALLLNINRMHTLRHPYITKEALGYRNMGGDIACLFGAVLFADDTDDPAKYIYREYFEI